MDIFLAAQCANVIVLEASGEAMRYYTSGNILFIFQQAWALIIPLLFLFTGFTGKLATFSERCGKKWFFGIALYLALFLLITKALSLPLDFYAGYFRQHEYGLSTQSLSAWFGNYGKAFLVSLVGLVAVVSIFYLLLKKSPKRWWIYSSLVMVGSLVFTMLIQPIWIDPLFNKFSPMQNKALEKEILALAARSGISHGRVFEVAKSQETSMLNAYVTGFAGTERIVLWDTTIKEMKPDEIRFVMGHEMGHYVLHHIWWSLLITSVFTFIVFYLLHLCAGILLHRFHKRFGFTKLSSIASFPLLFFLGSFFLLLLTPLFNFISRQMEHEADRFGLEITQCNEAAGRAFLVLQQGNLANPRPGPIYTFWRGTHPSLGDRVDFCNHYCPWEEGKPLTYEKYFNPE